MTDKITSLLSKLLLLWGCTPKPQHLRSRCRIAKNSRRPWPRVPLVGTLGTCVPQNKPKPQKACERWAEQKVKLKTEILSYSSDWSLSSILYSSSPYLLAFLKKMIMCVYTGMWVYASMHTKVRGQPWSWFSPTFYDSRDPSNTDHQAHPARAFTTNLIAFFFVFWYGFHLA